MAANPPTLPQELLNTIVDYVAYALHSNNSPAGTSESIAATRNLCALSLSARPFWLHCRRHLFHTVDLFRGSRTTAHYEAYLARTAALFGERVEAHCGPASLVQRLRIVLSPTDFITEVYQARISHPQIIASLTPVLPIILQHLNNLQSFQISTSADVFKSPLKFEGNARLALLDCLRRNPLTAVSIHDYVAPCAFLLHLPSTLQSLDLQGVLFWCGRDPTLQGPGWRCNDCNIAWDDVDRMRSCDRPAPSILTVGGPPSLSKELAMQTQPFFSNLTRVSWRIEGASTREDVSLILSHAAESLTELHLVYTSECKSDLRDDLYISPPASLPHLVKLSIELPIFAGISWESTRISPFLPLFSSVILGHLEHPCFAHIESLSVIANSVMESVLYKSTRLAFGEVQLIQGDSLRELCRLDSALADGARLRNLKQVDLTFKLAMLPYPDGWSQEPFRPNPWALQQVSNQWNEPGEAAVDARSDQMVVRESLQQELMAGLCRAGERIERLLIDTRVTSVEPRDWSWWDEVYTD